MAKKPSVIVFLKKIAKVENLFHAIDLSIIMPTINLLINKYFNYNYGIKKLVFPNFCDTIHKNL